MTREAKLSGLSKISKMDRLIVVDIIEEGGTLSRRECEVRWLETPQLTWELVARPRTGRPRCVEAGDFSMTTQLSLITIQFKLQQL